MDFKKSTDQFSINRQLALAQWNRQSFNPWKSLLEHSPSDRGSESSLSRTIARAPSTFLSGRMLPRHEISAQLEKWSWLLKDHLLFHKVSERRFFFVARYISIHRISWGSRLENSKWSCCRRRPFRHDTGYKNDVRSGVKLISECVRFLHVYGNLGHFIWTSRSNISLYETISCYFFTGLGQYTKRRSA